jgi:hypothetical protein
MNAQREMFTSDRLQLDLDVYASKAFDQIPLDMRDNRAGVRVGDVALILTAHDDIPVWVQGRRGSRAMVEGLKKRAPKATWNTSKLWVPDRHRGYVTVFKARLNTSPNETRWVVDTIANDMVRVANRYDVWILEGAWWNQLAAVRRRFKLVDGVAWMTGERLR